MTTTVAGVLVAVYVVHLFFTHINRAETLLLRLFTLNLIYEGFINVGYFVTVSSQTFKVADFLQFVCVFLSLLILLKKGLRGGLIAFIGAVFMSVVMLLLNPMQELVRTFNGIDFVNNMKYMHYPSFDLQTVKTSVRLICFAINGTAVTICMTPERWENILDKYLKAGRIVIAYAWIEFVLKNILNITITETLIRAVFGSDTSIMTSLERNGLFVVIGFNNEPSQFCMMLFSYYLVYLMSQRYLFQTPKQVRLAISGIALMVLCGSFRVVGMLPILLIIYIIINKKNGRSAIVVSVLSLILAVLYEFGVLDYYILRLERTLLFTETLDATIGGGEAGRLNTIIEAFGVFAKRPIFGIGPGQTFAYGFIPSILAMTGLCGLVTWYYLMLGTIGRIGASPNKKRWLLIMLVISAAWVYTDSIAIGYGIYVMAMMFNIRFEPDNGTASIRKIQNGDEAEA